MSALGNGPLIKYYNGVTFPTESEAVGVDIVPNVSSCGRRVISTTYTISIRAVLGQDNQEEGQTTDGTMEELRQRLMVHGKEAHFEAVGMGTIAVQVPENGPTFGSASRHRDVRWGPQTRLKWRPLGQAACEVDFTLIVCLACEPDGPESYTSDDSIYQWCWKWATDVDASGFTRRTASGFIQVAGVIDPDNPRTLTDQADRLRERVTPPLLPGFRRGPKRFDLDEAKTKLTYSIEDTEHPSPNWPEPGTVDVQASHTLRTGNIFSNQWRAVVSASYELSREVSRANAEGMFWRLVADRVRTGVGKPFQQRGRPGKASVFYIEYEASEPELYGRRCAAFRLSYRLLCSLRSLVEVSGLWRPLQGGDWNRWASSLSVSAWAPRGHAGLRFDRTMDAIVDLCESPQRTPLPGPRPQGPPRDGTPPPFNEAPDPGGSWMIYICHVRLERTDETVELKPLPPARPGLGGAGQRPSIGRLATTGQAGGREEVAQDEGRPRVPSLRSFSDAPRPASGGESSGVPPRTFAESPHAQRRAAPTWHAILYGFAFRAGHPIDPPALLSVGGFPVEPADLPGYGFSRGVAGSFFGVPLFHCEWNRRYLVLGEFDGDCPIPDNPMDT